MKALEYVHVYEYVEGWGGGGGGARACVRERAGAEGGGGVRGGGGQKNIAQISHLVVVHRDAKLQFEREGGGGGGAV